MERCDFSSIMNIIRRYISDDHEMNQADLIMMLFGSFCASNEAEDVFFENSQVCRWMTGQSRINPRISGYYAIPRHMERMIEDMQCDLFPLMTDTTMACREIYELLIRDPSVSDRMKKKLTSCYPPKDENDEAATISSILCFGMSREFVKRKRSAKALPAGSMLSPVTTDHIFGCDTPHPCSHFCGRNNELIMLHDLLTEHERVFVTGIPGIGKSELAKTYATAHKNEYTNIIYLTYTGDLRRDIADLDFADDVMMEDEQQRFDNHDRFLRTLKEDSLLIIDNFNTTASAEKALRSIKRYSCHILFTSRSRWERQAALELTEISDMAALLGLVGTFYSDTENNIDTITAIIEIVHRHTLAVELAARLLENGILTPEELLTRFKEEHAAMSATDKVNISKDGKVKKKTYYDHIRLLFSLYRLSEGEQLIMRCMTFLPVTGISSRLFAQWMLLPDLNTVNDLVEAGFIQPKAGRSIALHPMIREVAQADLKPSISNCRGLIGSLHGMFRLHGIDVAWYRILFYVTERIAEEIINDDMSAYLLFLEDAIQYMDNYQYTSGIASLQKRLKVLLKDPEVGTDIDRALLSNNDTYLEDDPSKMLALYKKALKMLPEVTTENALLVSNLHANAGNMYRVLRQFGPAKEHMETAMKILQDYGLDEQHDSLIQRMHFGFLLSDTGHPEEALKILKEAEFQAAAGMGTASSDYASILEAISIVCLESGDIDAGTAHMKKAMKIYEDLYEGDEDLINAKRLQILNIYGQSRIILAQKRLASEPIEQK